MAYSTPWLKKDDDLGQRALKQGRISAEEHKAYQLHRAQVLETQGLTGLFCQIDPASESLLIEDISTGRLMGTFSLGSANSETPEFWGLDQIYTSLTEGKQLTQQDLHPEHGLLIQGKQCLLYPFSNTDSYLLETRELLSPHQATQHLEAYDMYVSPASDVLFVVHRWAGKLSAFSLSRFECLGQVQITARGRSEALNLAIDSDNQWVYLTDNYSQQLYLLEYPEMQLKIFKTHLGILGRIALCPHQNALYYTRLKPKFGLGYMDLNTLEHLKELNIKGKALSHETAAPTDLLVRSTSGQHLLFVSCLDQPEPKTPIVQVIDTLKTKTIRRYALKASKMPYLLGTAVQNPFYESSILAQIKSGKPIQSRDSIDQETLEIVFCPEAENEILTQLQSHFETHFQVRLAHHPLVLKQLRVKAWETRQKLEQTLDTEVALEFQNSATQVTMQRKRLLESLQSVATTPPLYQPFERCALCGAHWKNQRCSTCGFALKDTTQKTPETPPVPSEMTQTRVRHVATDLMSQVAFINEAPEGLKSKLAPLFTPCPFAKSEVLIEEKSMGTSLYFVVQGELEVSHQGQRVATLAEGDVFGEMALILSEPRNATVKALTPGLCLRLERQDFLKAIQAFPALSRKLKALAQTRKLNLHQYKQNKQQHVMERLKARMAVDKLKTIAFFDQAPEAFFQDLSGLVKAAAYMPKKVIFEQGQIGDSMYFVSKGNVEVSINQGEWSKTLNEGDVFGEMSLLLNAPRNATVTTQSFAKIFEVKHKDLASVLEAYPEIQGRFQELVTQRQAELESYQGRPQTHFVSSPKLDITYLGPAQHNPEPIFVLSVLENNVLELSADHHINWHFQEQSQWQLFQPFRASQQGNKLFVVDSGNNRIFQFDAQNKNHLVVFGEPELDLKYPRSIDMQGEEIVLIADEGNQRLLVLNGQGETVWEYGPNEYLVGPYHAQFTPEGNILYTDAELHMVREINHQGEPLWQFGIPMEPQMGELGLCRPGFAHRMPNGTTLIADTGNHRLLWVEHSGQVLHEYTGTDSHPLIEPIHCHWDSQGRLYIFSESSEMIQCLDAQLALIWQGVILPG